jgi:hypothetical protein
LRHRQRSPEHRTLGPVPRSRVSWCLPAASPVARALMVAQTDVTLR